MSANTETLTEGDALSLVGAENADMLGAEVVPGELAEGLEGALEVGEPSGDAGVGEAVSFYGPAGALEELDGDDTADAVEGNLVSAMPWAEGHGAEDGAGSGDDSDSVCSEGSIGDSNAVIARRRRKYAHEDSETAGWADHKKHVFVLSSAGKPIYTRFGDESKLCNFFGILQAIVSFVTDDNDSVDYLRAGDHVFVFHQEGPLHYVVVSRTHEPPAHHRLMLEYIHHLIVSVLTGPYIESLFRQRPHYDLRRMLGGTEPLIDALVETMDWHPSFVLGSAQCLRLPMAARASIGQAMQNVKVDGLLYALLIADGNYLVSLVRPKARGLHPKDLLLLMNFVRASPTLRDEHSESWTPFCLPHFNDGGHLHIYGNIISPGLCLLLLNTDVEHFHAMQVCQQGIATALEITGGLDAIVRAQATRDYAPSETGIPGLLHFLYKSSTTRQYTTPAWDAPYVTTRERKRLYRLYQDTIEKVHTIADSVKIYYQVSRCETILAWVASSFELYVVFGPLVPKYVAIAACNDLLRWIKTNESELFILNSPVW